MTVLTPRSEDEAVQFVREARGRGEALRLEGGGTQAGLGRPTNAASVLSSRGLIGITLHEPAELVISARAGTPLHEVEAKLAETGQILPFEPVDLKTLYGTTGEPTVGGLVAGNWSGPRRIAAGAARDHLIGVRFVNGRGEVVKSGGRVMKNVTGLDLVKLQCGAHGTLGFITEVTFKVLPKAEAATTLVYSGLDDARAVTLLTAALTSPFEVSGAAHLPAMAVTALSDLLRGEKGGLGPLGPLLSGLNSLTVLRLENFRSSLDYRCGRLEELLSGFGRPQRLGDAETAALWAAIRDGQPVTEPRDRAVWRLSVPPRNGAEVVGRLPPGLSGAHYYDWGGGLIWLATDEAGDVGAAAIRAAIAPCGGHATLLRAPDAVRAAVPVFQPLAAPVMALTRRIKASFDPDLVLNPGRMYADA
jgi:glycolate oxidase FAD binding subunit